MRRQITAELQILLLGSGLLGETKQGVLGKRNSSDPRALLWASLESTLATWLIPALPTDLCACGCDAW